MQESHEKLQPAHEKPNEKFEVKRSRIDNISMKSQTSTCLVKSSKKKQVKLSEFGFLKSSKKSSLEGPKSQKIADKS